MDRTSGLATFGARGWKRVRWALAIVLTLSAAWLSIRRVQWHAVSATLEQANIALLVAALGTVLATTLAKSLRWKVLLRPCGTDIGIQRVIRVLFIGQMANSLLPGRLGEAARAVLIGPWAKGGVAAVVGTLVLEKALDSVAGIAIIIMLLLWTPIPAWLRVPALSLTVLTAVLLALLVLAASQRPWTVQFFDWSIHFLPQQVQSWARNLIADFRTGLGLLREPADGLVSLALTAAIWILAALTNVLTMSALNVQAPGWTAWLVLIAVYVASFLPAVPAQVGVFEYACVLSMGVAGIGPGQALAFGFVLHLVVYLPPAVLGPISMASEGLTWHRLTSARRMYVTEENAANTLRPSGRPGAGP